MDKRIIYETRDGIGVIIPSPRWNGSINGLAQKDVPQGCNYKIVDVNDLPSDRYFREALKYDLSIDMVKAREIHMNNIRLMRDKKLAELDIETLKGNDVQAEKQVLRDIPQSVNLEQFTTPDELRAFIPDELK